MDTVYCDECINFSADIGAEPADPDGSCHIRPVSGEDFPPRGRDEWCREGVLTDEARRVRVEERAMNTTTTPPTTPPDVTEHERVEKSLGDVGEMYELAP